jgi:pimeloyl-CoA dehydrogenase
VFAVDAASRGVEVRGFATLDGRRAAHVDLDAVTVPATRLLGEAGAAADAIEAAVDAGIAALCAEAAGAVEALLVHTADHLRTRKQFGAPLAKFQVLQHRVADLAMALEQLKSMACVAAMAVESGPPAQRRKLVSAAKVLASQLGRQAGLAAIQLHGAMGMTDECRVGHYAKRLIVIGQLFGDAAWHLRRVTPAH